MNQQLTVIGLMSGTSLDGIDLCASHFNFSNDTYTYHILAAETIYYNENWKRKLKAAYEKSPDRLNALNETYGIYLGNIINQFIEKHGLEEKVDLIGSHGHTIFHQPEKGFTLQIGDGEKIAEVTGIDTISDFRSLDVSLGGQGAPLVPVGDYYLFSDYESCLNLGGIANISFDSNHERIAFDICPCNLPLNKIVHESFNLAYDKKGALAKSGEVIPDVLNELNALDFYQTKPPKSLGQEWLDATFYTVLSKYSLQPKDALRTIVEHETTQIAKVLQNYALSNCFVTGGGAFNAFFIQTLKKKTKSKIILPNKEIIEFKEALVFAFLAYLKAHNKVNTLASVTGAKENSIGGVWHKMKKK